MVGSVSISVSVSGSVSVCSSGSVRVAVSPHAITRSLINKTSH